MILGPYILRHREDKGRITMYKICSITNKEYSVTVQKQQYEMLMSPNCPLVQDCLPELDEKQKEFVLSGTTPREWERMVEKYAD